MWITETDIKTYLRERYPREYRRMSKTGELERYAKKMCIRDRLYGDQCGDRRNGN